MPHKLSPHSIFERVNNKVPADRPKRVLVVGASGGIGQAFCKQLHQYHTDIDIIGLVRDTSTQIHQPALSETIAFDLLDNTSIPHAIGQLDPNQAPDWVLIATGWLHDDNFQPEKTYRSLSSKHMLHSFQLNTIGPSLLIKELLAHYPKQQAMKIGVLSARVGSISDNRLGGWHSYRASKAALNMTIKNFAIELTRSQRLVTICGLQPGTTATRLSAPFQRNVSPSDLQTVEYTAKQLIKVMQALKTEDSGRLFDFLGVPFEP